jgi:hypothetical protein
MLKNDEVGGVHGRCSSTSPRELHKCDDLKNKPK